MDLRDLVATVMGADHVRIQTRRAQRASDERRPYIGWMDLALYLRAHAFEGNVVIEGLWDSNHTPSTDDEWRAVYMAMVAARFPNPSEAEAWVRAKTLANRVRRQQTAGRPEAVAADAILSDSLEKSLSSGTGPGSTIARRGPRPLRPVAGTRTVLRPQHRGVRGRRQLGAHTAPRNEPNLGEQS